MGVTGSERREENRNKHRDEMLAKSMLLVNALADILMAKGVMTQAEIEAAIQAEVDRSHLASKTGH